MFSNIVISATSNICETLKFHCASILLDELDCAGKRKLKTFFFF